MTTQSFAEVLEACTQRCLQMDAPLAERLNALANDIRHLDPLFAEVVDRMVNRLQQIEVGKSAPSVGDPMPLFVLPDETGRLVGLAQLLERGPVVMSFHRGHWCPYCRISADALAEIEPEVRAAGAEIVLITPEVQKFTSQLKSDARAGFSVLTDLDSGYALELQLAIKIEDEKRLAMTRAGWDISAFQDNENWTLPIPATFVVGSDGSVKARFVDPDYRKRMDVDDILAPFGHDTSGSYLTGGRRYGFRVGLLLELQDASRSLNSVHVLAAVDRQGRPGHEAELVGDEE